VKNIITYIQNEKKAISKSFALYDKEKGGPGGSVLLKLVRRARCARTRETKAAGRPQALHAGPTVTHALCALTLPPRVRACVRAQNFIPKGATAPLGVVAPVRASAAAGASPAAADAAAAPEVNLGEHNVVVSAEEEAHAPTHVTTVKSHGGGPPIALIAGAVLAVVAAVAAAALGGGAAAPPPAPAAKGKGKAAPAKGKAAPASAKKAPASPSKGKAPASPKKGGKK
jgi:hypothetical protein